MIESAQPILVHDTTRVLYANEPACALFCCAALTLVMKTIKDLVISEDFHLLIDVHMRVLRERGDAPEIEYPFVRCDLTIFYAKVTSQNLGDGLFSMAFIKTFEWW